MLFESNDAQQQAHVLKYFQPDDFRQGKLHLVEKLRAMVAAQLATMQPEEFLDFVLTLVTTYRANASPDQWNPIQVLEQAGFQVLLHATNVLAVEERDDNIGNLHVCYKQSTGEELVSIIPDGHVKLAALKRQLCKIFATRGNVHWATATDVVFLGEACMLGFVIFTNRQQGNDGWLYGFNPRRGDFPYWLCLYCIDNFHFKALRLHNLNSDNATSHWPIDDLPEEIRQHYNFCNRNNPVGSAYAGGIS